ncbi:integrase [Streptomyces sp. ASQP_92]|uniref:integrase n=1 Tax=Streptomyces sp. ASQP_92 TaxID=2979116 RepID=UPI0021BE5E56|nr:integrase [Streptomyces sp. ASQP_92]MCT9090567.1 integrase [Streptomyces sp. ASQP_92]
MTQTDQEMTHEELMTLPVVVPLETANRALGIGRTRGYDMAKREAYPVRVLRHGRRYTVSRYDLHRHLGVVREGDAHGRADAA